MSVEGTQDHLMDAAVNEGEEGNGGNDNDGPTASASEASPPDIKKKAHKKRKASKGRLKKLWRRAAGPPPGITSRSEWLELMELHSDWKSSHAAGGDQDPKAEGGDDDKKNCGGGVSTDQEAMLGPIPGPSVTLATQKSHDFGDLENWQTTEGSDHRDVLMNLLFSEGDIDHCQKSATQQKKKKRKSSPDPVKDDKSGDDNQLKRQPYDNTPPLPSWSNIGNLASVGGVAVIEIEIVGGENDASCPLMPSEQIKNAMEDKSTENIWSSLLQRETNEDGGAVKRTIGAACKVKLFQGIKQPKCSSEALMYLPSDQTDGKKKKSNGCADFHQAMKELLLRRKQMRSEGFPIEADTFSTGNPGSPDENVAAKSAMEKVRKISETRLSVADVQNVTEYDVLELVKTLSIEAVLGDPNEEDNDRKSDEFSETEHYVKSLSLDQSALNDSSEPAGEAKKVYIPKVYALDCEMVETPAGPELARVSVIMLTEDKANPNEDEKYDVVLDELVKPRRKILDFLTEYSGIKPKMLIDVGTRIEHIQLHLLSLIDENDILVGHSLENDLRALRLVHTKVVDTSVVFRGITGRKFSLRHLSNVLLQKKIQQGCGTSGHCSTEDAEAALILALRRARRGSSFGLKENGRKQNILTLFQRINREASDQSKETGCFAERNDGSCVCIGPNDWIMKYAQSNQGAHHVLNCESLMNSMSMAVPSWLSNEKSTKRAGLLWANLRCESRSSNGKGQWKNEVKKLDELMGALIERVPTSIPILFVFQQNYEKAIALTKQRKAALNPKATCSWTSVQEDEWNKCMEQSRLGEAVWIGGACSPASS